MVFREGLSNILFFISVISVIFSAFRVFAFSDGGSNFAIGKRIAT